MKRLFTAIFLFASLTAFSQERTYLLGMGSNHLLDTYLSPEHYSGEELRLMQMKEKPLKDLPHWSRITATKEIFSITSPRADNASDMSGLFEYTFGMRRTFDISENFTIAVGGQADAFIGGIYNTRNGNNPAQMKLGIDLAPSFKATYRFRLLKKDMCLKYRGSLPLVGVQFSPAYGQSYYEIFSRGNYDRNVVPTTFISTPSLRQTVTADFALGRTTLRIGYLGDMQQAHVNNIKWHTYTHAFLIGIVRRFKIMNLRP